MMMVYGINCTTLKKQASTNPTCSGQVTGHNFVDLGLPSGILWATCNVGATRPTEYGDLFAWGEPKPKTSYWKDTYKWCENKKTDSLGVPHDYTKYCTDSAYGTIDNKTELEAEDDAATANWGYPWRMPTLDEIRELYYGCEWEWANNYNGTGVAGMVGTSTKNKNTIFLPAGGFRLGPDLYNSGEHNNLHCGYYWSSSLYKGTSVGAHNLILSNKSLPYNHIDWRKPFTRYYGLSVRAVVR